MVLEEVVPPPTLDWLPEPLRAMRYRGSVHPGALSRPQAPEEWPAAANCQVFAYRLVDWHGRRVPWLRSSELWEDREDTVLVTQMQALDLVLLHRTPEAWGAHVAVAIDDTHVVHLARRPGHPEVRTLASLLEDPRYRYLIGIKRPGVAAAR
ncbi:MAG: hypothetical protein AAGA48_03745 [Myxococcota bacterium]